MESYLTTAVVFVAAKKPSGILQTARVTHLKNNEMAKDVRVQTVLTRCEET
jgi:hypothetical protein